MHQSQHRRNDKHLVGEKQQNNSTAHRSLFDTDDWPDTKESGQLGFWKCYR